MPSYQFDKFLEVKINSQANPLSGQKNRSSKNYDFNKLKTGMKLLWSCPANISFDVMEDRSLSSDPITFSNIKNGSLTDFPSESAANGLYIANPKNASSEFTITATSIFENAYSNWMATLPDSTSISKLSIPGTHDSGATWGVSYTGRCQTLSIFSQLTRKGVRFLDIRCKIEGIRLRICHGFVTQNIYLDDVINDCETFLAINLKETIIMSIKNEPGTDERAFEELLHSRYSLHPWFLDDRIPTLGESRGRMILFRRFAYFNRMLGINASPQFWRDNTSFTFKGITVQDVYRVNSGNEKFTDHILPFLRKSANKDSWYINFASAIDSILPPNAASVSNIVNPQLHAYSEKFSGVILMDYIDQNSSGDNLQVAKKIINMNYK